MSCLHSFLSSPYHFYTQNKNYSQKVYFHPRDLRNEHPETGLTIGCQFHQLPAASLTPILPTPSEIWSSHDLGLPHAVWTASCDTPRLQEQRGVGRFPVTQGPAHLDRSRRRAARPLDSAQGCAATAVSAGTGGGGGPLPREGNCKAHEGAGRRSSQWEGGSPPGPQVSRDGTRNPHHHPSPPESSIFLICGNKQETKRTYLSHGIILSGKLI